MFARDRECAFLKIPYDPLWSMQFEARVGQRRSHMPHMVTSWPGPATTKCVTTEDLSIVATNTKKNIPLARPNPLRHRMSSNIRIRNDQESPGGFPQRYDQSRMRFEIPNLVLWIFRIPTYYTPDIHTSKQVFSMGIFTIFEAIFSTYPQQIFDRLWITASQTAIQGQHIPFKARGASVPRGSLKLDADRPNFSSGTPL